MRGLSVIYRRELAGLFLMPLAWILFFLALLYDALFFLSFLEQGGGEVNRTFLLMLGGGLQFWFLAVLLPPLLTMRMISEESKSGLLEFLLTAPVTDAAVVVGKTLAATTFMALVWAVFPLYGLLVQALGAPPDWGQVFAQWLGAVLVSGLFCAIGIVTSASTSTPILAAFLAIVANAVFVAAPFVGVPARGVFGQVAAWAIDKVDVVGHFQGSFLTGALDTAHVAFFLAWTGALLFLAVRIVESKRWLG